MNTKITWVDTIDHEMIETNDTLNHDLDSAIEEIMRDVVMAEVDSVLSLSTH